eukprot:SAG22_NODE_3021_length_2018_cov_0.994789_1_plen_236_part_00
MGTSSSPRPARSGGRCCLITVWVPSEGFHTGSQRTKYSRGAFYALARKTAPEEQALIKKWTSDFGMYCPAAQFDRHGVQKALQARRGPAPPAVAVSSAAPPAIVISLLSYAEAPMVREAVDNILRFTRDCTVVVHISNSSKHDYSDALPDMQWLKAHPRVEVNPTRLATRWGHGSLLAAHIANYRHMAGKYGARWLQEEGHFVFMADSARMISTGLEAYIQQRDGTVPHEQLDLR